MSAGERAEDERTMSFLQHLEELRRALIHSLVAVALGALIAWSISGSVLTWLIRHTSGSAIFMRPEGAFMARLKVALVLGLLLTLPYVFYRIWKFVGPGLLERERRIALPGALASAGLFYLGLAFSFFVMTPIMVRVLVGFGTQSLRPQTEIHFLLDLVFMTGLASGLVFQLPLFVGFLTWIGVLTPRLLHRYWRHTVVVLFILAAVLTPADPVSQIVLVIPLLILYALSLVLASVIHRSRAKTRKTRMEASSADPRPARDASPPR